MHRSFALAPTAWAAAAILLLGAPSRPAVGADVTVLQTNWMDRSITNVIEVRMPRNHFVNEYYTNWFVRQATNVFTVSATNWIAKALTNTIVRDAWHTNWLTRTLTNTVVVEALRTNFVAAYRTNWNTLTLSRDVVVEALQTNFVYQYQTNFKTLNLTNWQTVLVFKTNWVTQPVTNLVEIEMLTNRLAAADPAPSNGGAPQNPARVEASPAPAATITDALALEAARTARPSARNQAEVQLTARWIGSAGAFQVQQWRVESDNGAILCFGQDQQFKRELPLGKYRIEVKGRRDASGLLLVARGTMDLSAGEATIRQTLAARN